MKKITKQILILLLAVVAMVLLGGCGMQFDAAAYVKALLDNSYKNDSTAFVEQKLGTKTEAEEIYRQGIEQAVSDILIDGEEEELSISDELLEAYKNTFENIFSKVNYTVGEAEKQEDGSYTVTVTYAAMDVFTNAMTDYDAKVEAWTAELSEAAVAGEELPEEEELYDTLFAMLMECIDDAVSDVGYADEQDMTIQIECNDGKYSPNESDIKALEYNLLGLYE